MHKTLIVEDDPIARDLFSMIVENSDDFEIAGTIANANFAESFCIAKQVDLVLMDVKTQMKASGLEAAIKIKRSKPDVKVVIVTSQPEVDWVRRAREGNVDSFWYKMTEERDLLDVMRRTMRGETVYPNVKPNVMIGNANVEELPELQVRILRELTTGDKTTDIAKRMNLSPRTVDNNISDMLAKTGLSSRIKLINTAIETGIVIKDL